MIKIMFVFCILVSFPLQFYVPMERVEKWISRKVKKERQNTFVYGARYCFVVLTCEFCLLEFLTKSVPNCKYSGLFLTFLHWGPAAIPQTLA